VFIYFGIFCLGSLSAFLLAPHLVKSTFSHIYPLYTRPTEFSGRYFKVYSNKRFIFSSGAWPLKHHVFFSAFFIRDLPRGSVAFAIAHEYAHHKFNHHWLVFILNIIALTISVLLPVYVARDFDLSYREVVVVFLFSCFFSYITQSLITSIRHRFELRADRYAKAQLNSTPREVYKLLTYMSSAKKGYSSTHPDIKTRMVKLFPGIDLSQFTP
jgi:Zn-dependent protease with chaperone function